jgi:hypothetical protein
MIKMDLGIAALFDEGVPGNGGEARRYDAERLTRGVGINGFNDCPIRGRLPGPGHSLFSGPHSKTFGVAKSIIIPTIACQSSSKKALTKSLISNILHIRGIFNEK